MGFLGVTDYAINIDKIGKEYTVTLKGHNLSRSLLPIEKDKIPANEFNLQEYLDKIAKTTNEVTAKWSI